MADIEKTINGLEKLCNGKSGNVPFVCYDALELLKAQQAEIERLRKENDDAVTVIQDLKEEIKELRMTARE